MKLSNIDKARLATELCGLELCYTFADGTGGQWWKLPCSELIPKDDFDPENNWNHMRLVMEGVVEKRPHLVIVYGELAGVKNVGIFFDISGEDGIILGLIADIYGDTLPSAVCTAALEVLGKDGGK